MKKTTPALIAFLALLLYWACSKPEELAPSIEGQWARDGHTIGIEWHYRFHAGLLHQWYEAGGTVLTAFDYPYALRGDTVYIGGDTNNAPRTWLLHFECDDLVQVTQSVPPGLSGRFWLRRE